MAAAFWLLFTLVLAKTFGALLITLALAPLIIFCGVRFQLIMAAMVASIVLIYPLARAAEWTLIDQFSRWSRA